MSNATLAELFTSLSITRSVSAIVVDTPESLATCLAKLGNAKELAVDCEGDNLCAEGGLSLIQLYAEGAETIWIVDVTVLGRGAFRPVGDNPERSLKRILEDSSVTKVRLCNLALSEVELLITFRPAQLFFDVRNDANALYFLHSISLRGVYDIQLQELALRQSENPTGRTAKLLHGLKKVLEQHLPDDREANRTKASASTIFKDGWHVLDKRPLSTQIIKYAAEDVRVLFKLKDRIRTPVGTDTRVVRESAKRVQDAMRANYVAHGKQKAEAPKRW